MFGDCRLAAVYKTADNANEHSSRLLIPAPDPRFWLL